MKKTNPSNVYINDKAKLSAFIKYLLASYQDKIKTSIETELSEKIAKSVAVNYQKKIDELKELLTKKNNDKMRFEEQAEYLTLKQNELLSEIAEIKMELDSNNQVVLNLKIENKRLFDLAKRGDRLEDATNILQIKLESMHDKLHEKEEKITFVLEENNKLKKILEKKEETILRVEKEISNLASHNEYYKKSAENKEKSLHQFKLKNNKLSRELEKSVSQEDVVILQNNLKHSKKKINNLQMQVKALDVAIDEISSICNKQREKEINLIKKIEEIREKQELSIKPVENGKVEILQYKKEFEGLLKKYKEEKNRSIYRLNKMKTDQKMYEEEIFRLRKLIRKR